MAKPVTPLRSLAQPAALAASVSEALGCGEVSLQLIKSMVNDTYAVQTPRSQMVLRVYEPGRPREQIETEVAILAALKSQDVPVAAASFNQVIELAYPEGVRFAVLFEQAKGVAMQTQKNESSATAMGRALAQLHAAGERVDNPRACSWLAAGRSEVIKPFVSDAGLLEEVTGKLAEALANEPVDVGLIHGDADSSNALIESDQLTLIDFDDLCVGPRAYDAACFITEIECWGWPRADAMREAFLTGYRAVRAIDLTSLYAYQAARCMFVLERFAQRADVWGTFRLSDRFVNRLLHDAQRYLTQ